MSKMKDKNKLVFNESAECPHCGQNLIIKKIRSVIQPGIAAKYKDEVVIEKDDQQTLDVED